MAVDYSSYLPTAKAGAGIGGAFAGLFGGSDYGSATTSAAEYYQKYLDQARDVLEKQQELGRADITGGLAAAQQYGEPYRAAGEEALSSYLASLGLGGDRTGAEAAFRASPAYQFALKQGLKGIERSGALSGMTGTPAEQKSMAQYATGLASQEYGQWQKQLADLMGAGQTAAEQAAQREYGAGGALAQLGLPYASGISSLLQQYGQTGAEAQLAAAQAEAEKKKQKFGGLGSLIGAGLGIGAKFLGL